MLELENRIRSWVFEEALPFWTRHGIDREAGGYVERFDAAAVTPFTDIKRVRVIARQIYVFSHAGILGYEDGVKSAKWGFDFLDTNGWIGEPCGWARALSRDGAVLDATPDLYDQAFVLFALAWYYRASGDPKAISLANQTLDVVQNNYRANVGFWHEVPPVGHRQQNPHMHLLEAMLALYEAYPDDRYAELAREIVLLFQTHFYDADKRTLTEFFDQSWQPAAGPDGRITEPGHQFEWAWILVNARKLLNLDLISEAKGLIEFAEANGVAPDTGVTHQQVRNDGEVIDSSSRTWPNTERLKSAAALYYLEKKDPMPVFRESTAVLFDRHLASPRRGAWTEKFDANGQPILDVVPASTFYHLFLAFAEVLNVLDMLKTETMTTSGTPRTR